MRRSFEELLAEGAAVPVEGWDFSWFAGRATEERPRWGHSRLLADRLGRATASLDVQTGGGEVYAAAVRNARRRPDVVAATEAWHPNVAVARRSLAAVGGAVVEVADDGLLPFRDACVDLVSSRHPTGRRWDEIARVLRPAGGYFSQGIGTGSNRELYEFLMGPQPAPAVTAAERAVREARAAGLEVVDLREQATRVEFYDVAAVVHFLRKVVWTVPDFTVERYRDRLRDAHEVIERDGRFVAHSQRYLIEARKRA